MPSASTQPADAPRTALGVPRPRPHAAATEAGSASRRRPDRAVRGRLSGSRGRRGEAGPRGRGPQRLLRDVPGDPRHLLAVKRRQVTAIIGPSGCGKSTFLRTLNRMHELIAGRPRRGQGDPRRDRHLRPRASTRCELRRSIGMVFQQPNPFPMMSIYDNVAAGLAAHRPRSKADLDERRRAEPPPGGAVGRGQGQAQGDRASSLSGGQQQRLCIARALAVEPEVILMDEPASALDPVATLRIEELMAELRTNYTIVIVTHNMQQAARRQRRHRVLHDGRRPRRLPRRDGPDDRDLHQPEAPADRGLRVRSVRLSRGTTQWPRRTSARPTEAVTRQIGEIMREAEDELLDVDRREPDGPPVATGARRRAERGQGRRSCGWARSSRRRSSPRSPP